MPEHLKIGHVFGIRIMEPEQEIIEEYEPLPVGLETPTLESKAVFVAPAKRAQEVIVTAEASKGDRELTGDGFAYERDSSIHESCYHYNEVVTEMDTEERRRLFHIIKSYVKPPTALALGYDEICSSTCTLVHSSIGEITQENFHQLKEFAEKAAFGDLRTNTTVVDERVRKGLTLLPSQFTSISLKMSDEDIEKITLLAGTPKWETVPYRINYNRKGDFFMRHVDTPVGPRHFGTLLMRIHGDYMLKLETMGEVFEATGSVAFFSDMPHRVPKLKSGDALTAVFNLLKTEEPEHPPVHPDVVDVDSIRVYVEEWGTLGLILKHTYPPGMMLKGEVREASAHACLMRPRISYSKRLCRGLVSLT